MQTHNNAIPRHCYCHLLSNNMDALQKTYRRDGRANLHVVCHQSPRGVNETLDFIGLACLGVASKLLLQHLLDRGLKESNQLRLCRSKQCETVPSWSKHMITLSCNLR